MIIILDRTSKQLLSSLYFKSREEAIEYADKENLLSYCSFMPLQKYVSKPTEADCWDGDESDRFAQ